MLLRFLEYLELAERIDSQAQNLVLQVAVYGPSYDMPTLTAVWAIESYELHRQAADYRWLVLSRLRSPIRLTYDV